MTRPAVFLSAGEPSGDRHAAALATALRQTAPDCELAGIGGPAMARAGVRLIHGIDALQAIGLVEAAASLPAHVRALRAAARTLGQAAWDVVVLVDYPGFHRRLAALARRRNIPVLHYIAPQLWAWGEWRVRGFRRVVTHTAVILPFEVPFFQRHHVPVTYVGHPLLDAVRPARDTARVSLALEPGSKVVGLFPGSRRRERHVLWPVFRAAAERLRRRDPGLRVLVAAEPDTDLEQLDTIGAVTAPPPVVAAAADAAIAKSGTTTLELALAGTPHVVAYRMHPVTWAVARAAVSVPWVGLVNLVLGRSAVPELLQYAANPEKLAAEVERLLQVGGPAAAAQRSAFVEVARRLGPIGASRRTAALALGLVP